MSPEGLARNGHHGENEDQQTDCLDMSRESVDRGVPVQIEGVGVMCPAQTFVLLLFLITMKAPTIAAPTPKVINTPTSPATLVPVTSSSTPLTP